MQKFAPSYYKKFNCIKGKCKHNCCIGWEIDIDSDTYDFYKSVGGELGQRLKNNIEHSDCPHFILKEGERCPFLNKDNLCDIILELGTDALCDICALHPRFVNEFENRVEIGLGLCCEEAARIILTDNEKFRIELIEGEKTETNFAFLILRKMIFEVITNRSLSIDERIEKASEMVGVKPITISRKSVFEILAPLERLDEAWDKEIETLLKDKTHPLPKTFGLVGEQLLTYFLYRHLSSDFTDSIEKKYRFAVFSFIAIKEICKSYKDISIEKIIDIARMYSSEVEYSDENMTVLMA